MYVLIKITGLEEIFLMSRNQEKAPTAALSVTNQLLRDDETVVVDTYSQLVHGEHRITSFVGPSPPPGFFVDINDNVLLSYDPYFGTSRKEQASPSQLADKDLYYARDELPICMTSALSLRTCCPPTSIVSSSSKGRFVVATRDIKAGEVIAMDTSAFAVVHDARAFLHPPSATVSGKKSEDVSARSIAACCRRMMRSAMFLKGTKDVLIATHRMQNLCSLLITHGDLDVLPRTHKDAVHCQSADHCACGATRWMSCDLFGHNKEHALLRSSNAERRVKETLRTWWRTEINVALEAQKGNESDTFALHAASAPPCEMNLHAARLALQCVPVELLQESWSKPTACCGTKVPVFGFLSRNQLHRPHELARWFSVWDANSIQVQVPDLLGRSALFPFLRFFEHECRPNCRLVPLDAPATHTYGAAGQFHYDTKAKDFVDPYSEEAVEKKKQLTPQKIAQIWWPCESTSRIFCPSVMALCTSRDVSQGECLSVSYIPASYMTQPQRVKELRLRYQFTCTCRWCTVEPDLARAFICPRCTRLHGAVCPVGDGTKWDMWECLQCGHRPDTELDIPRMLDAEQQVSRIKADKAVGLVALLDHPVIHYTHAHVFKKLDAWSEQAWVEQDAPTCISMIEALQRCARRVFDPCDASVAQFHEFMGQVQHAVGNAHTARHEYFTAYRIRVRGGNRFSHWTRKTQFMAAEKSLVDFLDSR